MTTRINVTVGQESLLARAESQRQANRTGLARLETQKRVEAKARQKRLTKLTTSSSSSNATAATTSIGTGGSASTYPKYTPSFAANRFPRGGDLGVYAVGNPPTSSYYVKTAEHYDLGQNAYVQKPIEGFKRKVLASLDASELRGLSVLTINPGRTGVNIYDRDLYFGDNLPVIVKFALQGGIVVIADNYWKDVILGQPLDYEVAYNAAVPVLNSDINQAFGTSINQIPSSGGYVVKVSNAARLIEYVSPVNRKKLSSVMPEKWVNGNTACYSGANTLYRSATGFTTSSWQKVGKGILVRVGDQGETESIGSTFSNSYLRMFLWRYYTVFDDFELSLSHYPYYSTTSGGRNLSFDEGLLLWQKSGIR